MTKTRKPTTGRSAWRPSDFESPEAYSVALTDAHLAAFDAALGTARAGGRRLERATLRDFALDSIAGDLAAWRAEALHGRGFVVLRGLDGAGHTEEALSTIFWGLGLHLGRAVSQSPMGDRIGHVTDVGGQDRRERAYRNSRELTMHTETAALDHFAEVAARPDVRLEFTMEPGEAVFFNNCTMLHSRTAFEDHPDPARKRHLLRLWLMLDGGRPLVSAVHAYKGTQGIEGRGEPSTYYTGAAMPMRY